MIKKLFKKTCQILLITGSVGFLGGAFIAMDFIDYNDELPLGEVSSTKLDENGNIYLSLEFYGYIQKYSSKGEFIKNWRVESASGGAFVINCIEDKIVIYTARGKTAETYDLEGKLISKEKDLEGYRKNSMDSKTFLNENGECNVEGYFNRKVVCHNFKTNTKSLIEMNLINKILRGPIPVWLYAFVGIMGLNLIDEKHSILKQLKKKTAQNKA